LLDGHLAGELDGEARRQRDRPDECCPHTGATVREIGKTDDDRRGDGGGERDQKHVGQLAESRMSIPPGKWLQVAVCESVDGPRGTDVHGGCQEDESRRGNADTPHGHPVCAKGAHHGAAPRPANFGRKPTPAPLALPPATTRFPVRPESRTPGNPSAGSLGGGACRPLAVWVREGHSTVVRNLQR